MPRFTGECASRAHSCAARARPRRFNMASALAIGAALEREVGTLAMALIIWVSVPLVGALFALG